MGVGEGESREGLRLAVDIGGTFTDVALAGDTGLVTAKVLTTPREPERGVMTGIERVLAEAGRAAGEVRVVTHGTTLATNALIERKGARTALVVTEGFRDSVEMAYENRFEQYDINVQRPAPLVPRRLRLPVTERVDARGNVLRPLDLASVDRMVETLRRQSVESVAIGLIHAYANPAHEQAVADRVARALPDSSITLSSDVCPEIREYERLSTACANAYVQPLMARYLRSLERLLGEAGLVCPLLLMTSGGGLTTVDTAVRHPIRLVESGPAGGALLAARVARELALERVVSFDMGGTTAKICLIDGGEPQTSRTFEVDRAHRFTKGSGLPLRIPVIEMVEIGAGGGSIARVDSIGRIQVGPDSAGSEPGPACYARGGESATVTDADLVLGRIDAEHFAGGRMPLDAERARAALDLAVGTPMSLEPSMAALAVSEVVDENMANAGRVHAVERGAALESRALVAFGGAAPLHAARLSEKLAVDRIVVPGGAGVGSAIGFIHAPVAYEVVRSLYVRLSAFDAGPVNAAFEAMHAEAASVVRLAAPDAALDEMRVAFMRYVGQGHEVEVPLPTTALEAHEAERLRERFDATYERHYGRTIPGMDVEVLTFTLRLSTQPAPVEAVPPVAARAAPAPTGTRPILDIGFGDFAPAAVYQRADLSAGDTLEGPAVIDEPQTSTSVPRGWQATVDGAGNLVLTRGDQRS